MRLSAGGKTLASVVLAAWALLIPERLRAGLPEPYGGRLTVACRPACRPVAPHRAERFDQLLRARQEHETLLRHYLDGSLVETLLALPPQQLSQGREWLLQLKAGLRDQRGDPLTAETVVASWQRLLQRDTASKHWWLLAAVDGALDYRQGRAARIRGLEVSDGLRLRVRLQVALPDFTQALSAVPLAPLASRARQRLGAAGMSVAGSGPFRQQTDSKSSSFAGHALGRPLLDELVWRTVPNDQVGKMELALGKVDVLVGGWVAEREAKLEYADAYWPVWLVPNRKRLDELPDDFLPVLAKITDRAGLAEYLGRDRVKELFDLYGVATAPPQGPRPVSDEDDFARQLALHQAGRPKVVILLYRSGDQLERRLAEKLQVVLVRLGVALALVPADEQNYQRRRSAGDYHLRFEQPALLCQDETLRLLGSLAWLEGQYEQVPAMMAELLSRLAPVESATERLALVRQLQTSFMRRLPVVPLVARRHLLPTGPRIRGVRWMMSGLPDWSEAWVEPEHDREPD